jgi:hypothetical protein
VRPRYSEALPRAQHPQGARVIKPGAIGRIIGEYIEPGPRDAEQTLSRLIAVLETQDLARAIERIEKGHGLRVVK